MAISVDVAVWAMRGLGGAMMGISLFAPRRIRKDAEDAAPGIAVSASRKVTTFADLSVVRLSATTDGESISNTLVSHVSSGTQKSNSRVARPAASRFSFNSLVRRFARRNAIAETFPEGLESSSAAPLIGFDDNSHAVVRHDSSQPDLAADRAMVANAGVEEFERHPNSDTNVEDTAFVSVALDAQAVVPSWNSVEPSIEDASAIVGAAFRLSSNAMVDLNSAFDHKATKPSNGLKLKFFGLFSRNRAARDGTEPTLIDRLTADDFSSPGLSTSVLGEGSVIASVLVETCPETKGSKVEPARSISASGETLDSDATTVTERAIVVRDEKTPVELTAARSASLMGTGVPPDDAVNELLHSDPTVPVKNNPVASIIGRVRRKRKRVAGKALVDADTSGLYRDQLRESNRWKTQECLDESPGISAEQIAAGDARLAEIAADVQLDSPVIMLAPGWAGEYADFGVDLSVTGRIAIVERSGVLPDDPLVEFLLRVIGTDEEPLVRAIALDYAADRKLNKMRDAIALCLLSSNIREKTAAVVALAMIGEVDVVVQALDDDEAAVVRVAVGVLGRILESSQLSEHVSAIQGPHRDLAVDIVSILAA